MAVPERARPPCWTVTGNGATVALHRLMPGHAPNPHSHMHEQILYIMAGTMKLHVGNEVHIIGPGGFAVFASKAFLQIQGIKIIAVTDINKSVAEKMGKVASVALI